VLTKRHASDTRSGSLQDGILGLKQKEAEYQAILKDLENTKKKLAELRGQNLDNEEEHLSGEERNLLKRLEVIRSRKSEIEEIRKTIFATEVGIRILEGKSTDARLLKAHAEFERLRSLLLG
jgi:hypothetical protein